MRSSRTIGALVMLFATGLAGCEGTNDGTLLGMDQGSDFVVGVSGGVQPTYSWDGVNARSLVVQRASDGFQLWRLDAVDVNVGFDGPVTHGIVPTGAEGQGTPGALQGGVTYRVVVTRTDAATGRTEFTP